MSPQYEDLSTVISILPIPLDETKPGLIPANYKLAAVRDPASEIQTLLVARARFPVYIDENRPAIIVPEPSDRVAEAICRDYKVAMSHVEWNVAEPGLFWLKDDRKPADILSGADKDGLKELERYRKMQIAWFKRLVEEADDYWGKIRSRRAISDLQRKAADFLNLKREWNIDSEVTESMSVCRYCFAQIHPNAIVCPSCRGVLDPARYKKDFTVAETVRPANS
jgi:hypothetical protein